MLTYGSVCSGIESASVAWHTLGWRAEWFAEIEPFPSAVLAYRWPEVPNLGDMTKLAREVLLGNITAPLILVGGTPCQAFSVAGMREGLSDPRGQLTIKYVELADAVDHVRPAGDECIVVWENVPGVLSDKGNAFGCFLGALVGESDALLPAGGKWTDAGCVYGPRRTAAWRVLDAQYFGLAQRRRRVFVVASARKGFDPAAVLFESEGVRRDTPPSRGTGERPAGAVVARAGRNGGASNADADAGHLIAVHGTQDPDLRYEQAHTLGRNSGQENAVFAIQNATRGKDQNGLGIAADSPMYTLDQASQHAVCVTGDITHTLKADGFDGFDGSEDGTGRGQPIVTAFAQNQRNEVRTLEVAGALAAEPGMKQQTYLQAGSAVRRLTARECERLQGFKDDYTLIPWRGKPADECPDGPRYKAIGNSKAVPVVRWIGKRISEQVEISMKGEGA